jgi:Helix-loop-helix DNA-binding domain
MNQFRNHDSDMTDENEIFNLSPSFDSHDTSLEAETDQVWQYSDYSAQTAFQHNESSWPPPNFERNSHSANSAMAHRLNYSGMNVDARGYDGSGRSLSCHLPPSETHAPKPREYSLPTCSRPRLPTSHPEEGAFPVHHCATTEMSPTSGPTTPADYAWSSVADSAYGSLPPSNHGSQSSHAKSMMHATHYFTSPKFEKPEARAKDGCPSSLNSPIEQNFPLHETESRSPAPQGKDKERLRQDAHSKVEKRYRMNINNKIEQLRRILPCDQNPKGLQFLADIKTSGDSTRRRRSGTVQDLSKRDVLTQTISHIEHLQTEVQQLTTQNMALRQRMSSMGSTSSSEHMSDLTDSRQRTDAREPRRRA